MKNTENIQKVKESQKNTGVRKRFSFLASAGISLCLIILFSSITDKKFLYAQNKETLPAAQQDSDYKIGAEDVLYISVWKNEQLSREVVVRPDGKISFPLLDDLEVVGLTPLEVKEIITKKLALYIEDPEVTIILQVMNSHKIYITGAVGLPGVFNLTRKVTLFQLLAMADRKALSENVDLERAYILRGKKRLPVDFEKLAEEGDMIQDVDLLPDDIIYLPDNSNNRITVVGEVKTPRVVPFKKGTTVLDAVLMSGGPTDNADLNDTKIIRKKTGKEETTATGKGGSADKKVAIDKKGATDKTNKESATEIIKVRLKDIMQKGKLEDNIELQPMDVIIIPASIF